MNFVTISLVIRKIFASLVTVILWIPIFIGMTGVAFAADEPCKDKIPFTTSYDVVYDTSDDGTTNVTEKIALKNLTSECYASQFKLTIGATQISNVKAFDEGGAMDVNTQAQDTSTVINVKFNQQVAGLGKTLSWTLNFKSKDFAEKQGKIWEIRAPRISSSQNLESYNLTISVPIAFGEPTLITPTPKSQTISQGRMFLTFFKDQLTQSGVSASFGTNQLFDFDLTYHLENNNLVPILTNIALPPDTAYQDVIYQRMDPKPINVTVDDDGNYLAWYRLNRGQKLDIKVVGSSKLYTNTKVKNPSLPENLRKKYTSSDKYWEKDNPVISNKLSEIFGTPPAGGPPQDETEKAKLIFRYVVGALKYDSSRLTAPANGGVERLGAVTALNNPNSAVCMEFTDLFIALARTAGIPARELDGFGYTTNPKLRPLSFTKDILHAWPEYWDSKKGWVMVDPTWENTTGGVDYFSKLDLNHFVFAIKGFSSSQPAPAGSYKYLGQDSHDVKVTLSDTDFLGKPQVDVNVDASDPILSGFPGRIRVRISNMGNGFLPSANFVVSAKQLSILGAGGQKLGPIPAFGTADFNFNIRTKSLFDNYNDEIIVLIGSQKFSKDVRIQPFILFQRVPLIVVGIMGLMVLIYLGILSYFIYRKHFAKPPPKT